MTPTTRKVWIEKIEQQTNGCMRFTIRDADGRIKTFENAGYVPTAILVQTDDALFVEVYFESVFGVEHDPYIEPGGK